MGIGHELRGDDAAGLAVVRGLRPLAHPNLLVIDAGHAPENHTSPIRHFAPDLILLIDAAQLNEQPGTIRWLTWQETRGLSATTHTLPPYMLAHFLTAELKCQAALIGIQPHDTTLGSDLSPCVQTAVASIVKTLRRMLA